LSAAARAYRAANLAKVRKQVAAHYRRNAGRIKARAASRSRDYRLMVLRHYSEGSPVCACCGERHIEFLCVDHVNGGGNRHRKEIGGGSRTFLWLIRQGFPAGFRVLCHNCNSAIGHYGYCPHSRALPASSTG
jgi:hypothetical protein